MCKSRPGNDQEEIKGSLPRAPVVRFHAPGTAERNPAITLKRDPLGTRTLAPTWEDYANLNRPPSGAYSHLRHCEGEFAPYPTRPYRDGPRGE
eukprot:10806274-Heterocapsa_arctica.AAC.1